MMYYSFIMLKPDALTRELPETILQYFAKERIGIAYLGYRMVDEQTLTTHYAHVIEKYGNNFKRQLMDYFLEKPVMPMILESNSPDIIADIRRIVGATDPSKAAKGTVRGDLSHDSFEQCAAEDRALQNLIHASDSFENAKEETSLWFSKEIAGRYFAK